MIREAENKRNSPFIDVFDIYGHSLNLHLFGKDKYKTFIGSIFGIVSLMLMVAISVYFLIDLFQRKSMTIVFNEDNSKIPSNNLTDTPFMMTLGDMNGKVLEPEGLYWFDVKMLNYRRYDTGNGTTQFRLDIVPIQLEKCDLTKHFLDKADWFKKFQVSTYYCIPPGKNNLTIFGKYGDTINGWSYLSIWVNRCNPKLGHKCLNDTYIDNVLANTFLTSNFLSYGINHYNITSPSSIKVETTIFQLSNTLIKNYYYNIRQVVYDTDYGFIFEDHQIENFYTYQSQTIDVNLKSVGVPTIGPNIGYIMIRNVDAVSYYNRAYVKGQAVMANIGGIIKAVMVIAQIISDFITRRMMFLDISNRIFHFNLNDGKFGKSPNRKRTENVKINHTREQSNPPTLPMDNLTFKSDNVSSNLQKTPTSTKR
jgi:hypothetical protein